MSAPSGAVAQTQGNMNVKERLLVVEGEVAGQRQDLGLLLFLSPQVCLFPRVEVANDCVANRSDARQMAGNQAVLPGERQQTVHHFLARVENEKVRFCVSVAK